MSGIATTRDQHRSELAANAVTDGETVTARAWIGLAILCMGAVVVVLDTTIVNIAVPSIMSGLRSDLDQVLWVLNAYMLVYAAFLIPGGRLGDFYGPRRVLVLGISVFVAASLACSVSQSMPQLIAARVIQGIGGALLTPATLAIVPLLFPASRRGAAIGIWSGSAGLAAAIGPSLGGVLTTTIGWRAIFLVNLPLGLLTLVGAFALLPALRPGRKHQLDLGGAVLGSGSLFAIVFAVVEGQRFGWGAVAGPITIPGILVAGVVVLGTFVVWESRQPEPLVPLALFADRNFSIASIVIAVLQLVMLGLIVVASVYLQTVLHLTALSAGVALVAMPLTLMVVSPLVGRLSDRVDPRSILIAGLLVAASGLATVAAVLPGAIDGSALVVPLVITGAGVGTGFALVMTLGMRGSGALAGAAAGVLNTSRQVGGALGGAIAVAVLQAQLASASSTDLRVKDPTAYAHVFVGAVQWTFLAPIALLILSAAISARVSAARR